MCAPVCVLVTAGEAFMIDVPRDIHPHVPTAAPRRPVHAQVLPAQIPRYRETLP